MSLPNSVAAFFGETLILDAASRQPAAESDNA
jgi:hypothetical protein